MGLSLLSIRLPVPLAALCVNACAQFNMKPEKGIKFLLRSNVVAKEPEQVAHFLRTTPGLDKAS